MKHPHILPLKCTYTCFGVSSCSNVSMLDPKFDSLVKPNVMHGCETIVAQVCVDGKDVPTQISKFIENLEVLEGPCFYAKQIMVIFQLEFVVPKGGE
jgi:hypothetical protein